MHEEDLDAGHPLRSLLRIARRQRKALAGVLLLSALSSLLLLLQPILYREAVNDVAGVFVQADDDDAVLEKVDAYLFRLNPGLEQHSQTHVAARTPEQAVATLAKVVVLLFLISLGAALATALAEGLAGRLGYGMERGIVLSAFERALQLPLGQAGKERASFLAKQVDQVDQVSPVVSMLVLDAGPDLIRLIGILAIMLALSPLLAGLALLSLPFYVWLAVASTRRLGLKLDAYYDQWQSISARISERLAGLKTVRASGAPSRELKALAEETRTAYSGVLQRNRLASWTLFGQEGFVQVSKALVLLVGGWKAFHQQITPGDVVMLVAYIDQVYSPLDSLSGMGLLIQEHVASFRRGLRVARLRPAQEGRDALRPGPGRVELRGLSYSYAPGRKVLKGIRAKLLPGRLNTVVGPSGSGKSTLVELILNLRTPALGQIFLDGQDLRSVREAELRSALALVSADGILFSATVRENLEYQSGPVGSARLREALRLTGLTAVLKRLPHGLETFLDDGRGPLSLGERQRLQIARAILSRPRILVLDEATANLDAANEAHILELVRRLRGHCTVIAVSHRRSLARAADQVLVLDKGRLVGAGPPAQLARRTPYLRRLLEEG
jgi:ABC-type multidrug transport system fused ATPase/permease subunit